VKATAGEKAIIVLLSGVNLERNDPERWETIPGRLRVQLDDQDRAQRYRCRGLIQSRCAYADAKAGKQVPVLQSLLSLDLSFQSRTLCESGVHEEKLAESDSWSRKPGGLTAALLTRTRSPSKLAVASHQRLDYLAGAASDLQADWNLVL
jgi:hypothetical protein